MITYFELVLSFASSLSSAQLGIIILDALFFFCFQQQQQCSLSRDFLVTTEVATTLFWQGRVSTTIVVFSKSRNLINNRVQCNGKQSEKGEKDERKNAEEHGSWDVQQYEKYFGSLQKWFSQHTYFASLAKMVSATHFNYGNSFCNTLQLRKPNSQL